MKTTDKDSRRARESGFEAYKKKEKRERRKWHRIRSCVFVIIILALCVTGLLIPLRPTKSVNEKRRLARFPKLTAASLWNGDFFSDVATWYTDTFPPREALIKGAGAFENLYGIRNEVIYGNADTTTDSIPDTESQTAAPLLTDTAPTDSATSTAESVGDTAEADAGGTIGQTPEVAGNVYVSGDRAFSIFYFATANMDTYASMINTVKYKVGDNVNVYDLVAPTSFGVYLSEDVQQSMGGSSEKKAIAYIDSRLQSNVTPVDFFDDLVSLNSQYLYFRTDHHWTALGAYYAYCKFCQAKGLEPQNLGQMQQVEYDGFLGTLYSGSDQSPALAANPDSVIAYIPSETNEETITRTDGSSFTWPIIRDGNELSAGNKYLTFIGGDQPMVEIDNPAITDGSTCVVVKDSYGNAFVPFLVGHYQKVIVLDYRYYTGNATQLVKDTGAGDVIFVNCVDVITSTTAMQMNALFQ